MSRKVNVLPVVFGAATLVAVGAVACFSDPRGGEEVVVVDSCQIDKLSSEPSSPQSSLRAYLDASESLLKRANEVEGDLVAACNALNTELGLPTGADVTSACRTVATRLDAVIKGGTAPFGPGAPEWAELRATASCKAQADALSSCISKCAGPCDNSKCEAGRTAGKCAGTCKGECLTTGTDIPCNGRCVGEIPLKQAPQTCVGE